MDLQKYHENIFYKSLNEAKKLSTDGNSDLSKVAQSLNDSFENLVSTLISENNWSKFFNLIDHIETFRSSMNELKCQMIRLDEIYKFIGDIFYKLDLIKNALDYYKKAVVLSNEHNLLAIESFENLINASIERWHYRMINDKVRNLAYSTAIYKRLLKARNEFPNKTINVLDIGSGTGLLTALCVSNAINFGLSNINVFACEQNEFFHSILEKFLNSFKSYLEKKQISLKILKKHSNEIDLKNDLNGSKIDFVITEIFDDALLGEGCLNTFYSSICVNKLLNDSQSLGFSSASYSKIVPQSAKIYLCPIECEYLRQSNKFSHSLKGQNQFTISAFCLDNSFKFEKYFDLDSNGVNYEPYSTEDLNQLDFKYLSNPAELSEFYIKFDDKNLLEKYCKNEGQSVINKRFKANCDGRLDAYAVWFDLYLDDEIIVTNSPLSNKFRSKNNQVSLCWHQAIYNCEQDINITKEELFQVDVKLRNDCLLVFGEKAKASDQNIELELSRNEIALLNNQSYQNFYVEWFEEVLNKIEATNSEIRVGYLLSSFSILFFKIIFEFVSLLKERRINLQLEIFINDQYEEEDYFVLMVEKHFKTNNVKINFLKDVSSIDNNLNLDYLIYDPIDPKFGILRKNIFFDLLILKDCNLNKEMILFPSEIRLKSMLIESNSFLNQSELVSNSNLCINKIGNVEVDLKSILDEYNVKHQLELNMSSNLKDFKQLTEIKELACFDLNNISESNKFEIEAKNSIYKINKPGSLNACLYWYDLGRDGTKSYSPYEKQKNNSSNQMAGVKSELKNEKGERINEVEVDVDDKIKIDYLFKNNIFHIRNFEHDFKN